MYFASISADYLTSLGRSFLYSLHTVSTKNTSEYPLRKSLPNSFPVYDKIFAYST